MSLKYHPNRADVLICDFSLGGFIPPEMVKVRPVVVMSRRIKTGTCVVVPLSGTEPDNLKPWHHEITPRSLPGIWATRTMWAKCDMVCSVALKRLDRIKTHVDGNRTYRAGKLGEANMLAISAGLRSVMVLGD